MGLKIEIENQQKRVPLNLPQIKTITKKILRNEGVVSAQLSLAFVTDRKMKALNQRFLKRDHTTDVLAFDLGEDLILSAERPILKKKERRLQGEIIISATTAAANARRFATSVDYELILYVVHGILHLLGYDDHRPTDRKRMRSKEQEMMAILKWVGR